MKSLYIKELAANEMATATFLVQSKDIRQKKNGEPFLSMIFSDRTGEIDAKMWDNVDKVMNTFERDDFVKVKGLPQVFQNKMQLTVHTLMRISDSEVDYADYFPASRRDPGEMWAELQTIIRAVANPHLRALLEAIFADAEIARKFKRAPAAKTIHHAWLGGLLEHVLSLCALCRNVAPQYPSVDPDLLITGAILHDIGKIDELTYERGFGYSDEGQLVGHLVQGLTLIHEKACALPDFPRRVKTLVEHMILSHHGQLEFGSPKVPMFAEALLLHHLDNLDSKMEAVRGAIEKDKLVSGAFTAFVPSLERPILKKDRYLNPPPAEPSAPSPVIKQQPGPQASLFGDRLRDALKKD